MVRASKYLYSLSAKMDDSSLRCKSTSNNEWNSHRCHFPWSKGNTYNMNGNLFSINTQIDYFCRTSPISFCSMISQRPFLLPSALCEEREKIRSRNPFPFHTTSSHHCLVLFPQTHVLCCSNWMFQRMRWIDGIGMIQSYYIPQRRKTRCHYRIRRDTYYSSFRWWSLVNLITNAI